MRVFTAIIIPKNQSIACNEFEITVFTDKIYLFYGKQKIFTSKIKPKETSFDLI